MPFAMRLERPAVFQMSRFPSLRWSGRRKAAFPSPFREYFNYADEITCMGNIDARARAMGWLRISCLDALWRKSGVCARTDDRRRRVAAWAINGAPPRGSA